MSGARIVVEDIEKESMRLKLLEGDLNELAKDSPAQTLAGRMDDKTLEFDGAGGLRQATENGECAKMFCHGRDGFARIVVTDVVAGVLAGQCGAMAVLAPLSNKFRGCRQPFEGHDGRDVRGGCRAKEH